MKGGEEIRNDFVVSTLRFVFVFVYFILLYISEVYMMKSLDESGCEIDRMVT